MDGCASLAQRGKFGKFDNTEAQRHRGTEAQRQTTRQSAKKPQCPPCLGVLKYCNSAALVINIREVSTNQSQTLFFRDAFSLNIDTATDLA